MVVSQAVLARCRSRLSLTRMEPFLVKGKEAMIDAAIVHDVTDEAVDEMDRPFPLIGRDVELAQLIEQARGAWPATAGGGDRGLGRHRKDPAGGRAAPRLRRHGDGGLALVVPAVHEVQALRRDGAAPATHAGTAPRPATGRGGSVLTELVSNVAPSCRLAALIAGPSRLTSHPP